MQLKTTTDYAIRMMLYLAVHEKVCSAQEISENTGIDRTYLVQVAKSLRNAGLIRSVRGVQGGYELAQNPENLMLSDIVEPMEGITNIRRCDGSCEQSDLDASVTCSVQASYEAIQANLQKVFDVPLTAVLSPKGLSEERFSRRPKPLAATGVTVRYPMQTASHTWGVRSYQ